jgi:hypothetical protein
MWRKGAAPVRNPKPPSAYRPVPLRWITGTNYWVGSGWTNGGAATRRRHTAAVRRMTLGEMRFRRTRNFAVGRQSAQLDIIAARLRLKPGEFNE